MKYSTKLKQPQLIGKIKIEPKGGDLTADQVAEIKKDPWGRELILKGFLTIDGVKPSDVAGELKKENAKSDAPAAGDPTQTTLDRK